jgi:hypothetical protein
VFQIKFVGLHNKKLKTDYPDETFIASVTFIAFGGCFRR